MSSEKDLPSELGEAESALTDDRYDAARETARPFLDDEREAVRLRAKRITGLAYFHEGEHQAAVPYLQEVAEGKDTTNAWFNVAASTTRAGQPDVGAEAFERATELNDSDDLSLPKLNYHYAKALRDAEEYERALEPLDWLREAYAEVGIMDGTFLSMRGLPFLGRTLAIAVDVFSGLGRGAEGRAWMEKLASNVNEYGKELISDHKQELP